MNWNISAWSIRRPVPSLVLFLVLMTLGFVSFSELPVTRFPNIDVPIVQVRVYQAGAAPSELEVQVTKKVEDAIAGVNGVKHQTSAITEGASVTTIEFRLETNQDRAVNDVKDAIARIRTELPRTIEEPIITRIEVEGLPIVSYAARAPGMTPEQLSWFVDDTVARRLVAMPGVAQVLRVGGMDREINVVLDPQRLSALGVTAPQINEALRAFNVDASGGRTEIGGVEQSVRVLGAAPTVDTLRDLTIPSARGFVKLSDVASIGDGAGEVRGFARLNGRPVVGFELFKTKQSSEVTVEDAVIEAVAELSKEHPDVTFTRIVSIVDITRTSYRETINVLLEGMVLAAIVVFLFLRDWRTTLIAAVAMPVSMIPTFWVMNMSGFSLNLVSLLALTLVVGILVDDAIVEIENIQKRVRGGTTPYRAAYRCRCDWPCGGRDDALHRRRVRACVVHAGYRRAILLGVRPDRCGRRALITGGGTAADTVARRLLHAQQAALRQGRLGAQGLHVAGALVGRAQVQDRRAGPGDLRRLGRQLLSAAIRVPAGRRHRAHLACGGAAARLAHRRDQGSDRGDRPPDRRAA